MLGNITMSFVPRYGATFPAASVLTITLGKPMGSARIAAVPMAVPPPPPSEITPSILPASTSFVRMAAAAWAMAVTLSPRSLRATSRVRSTCPAAATSSREMSGFTTGGVRQPTSISTVRCPRARINSAT